MSLSRLSTFCLQSLINCSVVLFMFFNFFQPFVHPLSFSINDFGRDANNILYEGDAALSSGVIELSTITATDVQDISCRTGRATYAEPLHLWDSAKLVDFTTNFSFIIEPVRKETIIVDGLVFFLAPVHYPIPPNSAGGDLGLLNSTTRFNQAFLNQIVMVEFDTLSNSWDPPTPHVGININTISSDVNASWDALGNSGKKAHVQITYNATTKNLTVFLTYSDVAITSLSHHIDLKEVLPEWVTIGFSTANGCGARERNAIYTWDFRSEELSTKKERRLFSIGAVAVSVFILILGVAICWLVVKRRMNRIDEHGNDSNSVASTDLVWQALPRRFSYQELVAATNDFANDRRLGQGGSGKVYKGIIQDLGCTVAVKRIVPESEHYEKVFINEYEEYHVALFRWVWQLYLAGNLLSAADERLDMNFVPNEMECLLIVGLWCTHPDNKERPKAGQVMRVLQLEAPLPQLPKDLHDHPPPQPQQEAGSSQQSLTSSFETVGR
ncbi:hypothetical protein ACE6H2_027235 [Prunus campanulata]